MAIPNPPSPGIPTLHCKDCRFWYGAEDDEYGPCQLKNQRRDPKFVTFGHHPCDEPEALALYKEGKL